jgi:hypothetical protein
MQAPSRPVDTSSMTLPELDQFDAEPLWRVVLTAYQERLATIETGWAPRLPAVEGIDAAELSPIHGKLIAFGFLKFEMGTGDEGVQYQLTPLARQALLPPESRQNIPEWQLAAEQESAAA